MSPEEIVALEGLIDKHGLVEIGLAIAALCYEKAEHIRTNWNDDELAEEWDRRAKAYHRVHRSFTLC